MSEMVGADADELDRLARKFDTTATALSTLAKVIGVALRAAPWFGGNADGFRRSWTSGYARDLADGAGFLQTSASVLRRNAQEQRDASAPTGWGGSGLVGGVHITQQDERLHRQIREIRGASPEEQLRWWNSLTPDQQRTVLRLWPGELTALTGLPAAVLLEARRNYFESIRDQVVASETSGSLEGGVTVEVFKVGVGVDATQTTFLDDHVELRLDLTGKVGLKLAKALGADVGEGGSVTLSFKNADEANQFYADLAEALQPSWGNAAAFLLGPIAVMIGHADLIKRYAGNVTEVSQVTQVEAKAEGGGSELKGEVQVEAAHNLRNGEHSIAVSGEVDAKVAAALLQAQGNVEVQAKLTLDGATPSKVTFTAEAGSAALAGMFTDPKSFGIGLTTAHKTEVSFDLTDPTILRVVPDLQARLQRGDVEGVVRQLQTIGDRSEIVITGATGSIAEGDMDAGIASGGMKAASSNSDSIFVKPPGGAFYEVDPAIRVERDVSSGGGGW